MPWLLTFKSFLHAAEAAAQIAAPIVAAVGNPTIGALILQAANAAVGAELVFDAPGMGPQKAALVKAQTQATVDVINKVLVSQNKPQLAPAVTDLVQQQVKVIVSGLKTVEKAVEATGPATTLEEARA